MGDRRRPGEGSCLRGPCRSCVFPVQVASCTGHCGGVHRFVRSGRAERTRTAAGVRSGTSDRARGHSVRRWRHTFPGTRRGTGVAGRRTPRSGGDPRRAPPDDRSLDAVWPAVALRECLLTQRHFSDAVRVMRQIVSFGRAAGGVAEAIAVDLHVQALALTSDRLQQATILNNLGSALLRPSHRRVHRGHAPACGFGLPPVTVPAPALVVASGTTATPACWPRGLVTLCRRRRPAPPG